VSTCLQHQIKKFDVNINCFLNSPSELEDWIEMQNEVAAEPMNSAREKVRAAKEKVLSLQAIYVSITVI
jgi:hypothetical protein